MRFISYAQNYEDVMLWRALKHVKNGFYIDVGANDPEVDSVTKAFYDRGWRGINIEPAMQWYQKLVEQRSRDINLQLAVGQESGEMVFYELPDTGLSTLDKATAERHKTELGYDVIETIVQVRTLTEICDNNDVKTIHFLKIDVEGNEKNVLLGLDLGKIRPWIIVVESTLPNTQVQDHLSWESIVVGNNYRFVYFDGLNRYYVASEHEELESYFEVPPNYFDDFVESQRHRLESSLGAMENYARELEQRAAAAEEYAKQQEQRAEAAQAISSELEQRAAAAEVHARQQQQRAETAEVAGGQLEQRAIIAEEQFRRQQYLTASAEALIRELELKLTASDVLRQEIEQRATVAEEHGRVQELRAVAAETRGEELFQRLSITEILRKEQEQRAIATAAELDKTRAECTSALARLAALTQESQRWTEFAGQQLKEIAALHDRLSQQMLRNQALQGELATAHARVAELNQSSHHWWTVSESQGKDIASLKEQLTHQQIHINWLQNDLIASRKKVDQVNKDLCESKLYADRFYKELQEVYASRSWRVTLPMRKLFWLVRGGRSVVSSWLAWTLRGGRQALKWPFVALAAFVAERPRVKATVKRLVDRFPTVKLRLRQFAVNNNVMQPFPEPMGAVSDDASRMPAYSTQNPAVMTPAAIANDLPADSVDDLFPAEAISRVASIIHSRGGQ